MPGTAGIIASGHEETCAAGVEVLAAGGNAFDAALAALCAACVAEPLLTSLGGGGFLLAQPAGAKPRVYDFFTQTPARKLHEEALDFYPILADFGTARQEFHIGLGAMAVPGTVAGLFHVNQRLGDLDMATVMAPAVRLAREGVAVTHYQSGIARILTPILQSNPAAMRLVATDDAPDRIAPGGALVRHPDLADSLETLLREGPEVFYRGAWAQQLVEDCAAGGGQLTLRDLAAYRVIERAAVEIECHGVSFALNAPPSPGGTLLGVALAMLDGVDLQRESWGSARHVDAIAHAMRSASRLRRGAEVDRGLDVAAVARLLGPDHLAAWRGQHMPSTLFTRGTTHISVADEHGNLASLTSSNGEGCGYVLPGTGIMLNNMLGEEDLNPQGFHRWPENVRLASMMCPTLATLADGSRLALGSGGSNRIRSAVLQVLVNLFGLGMPLSEAVMAPRMHLEGEHLGVEAGYSGAALDHLRGQWPDFRLWPEPSLFFGGVHAVELMRGGAFRGAGDLRRGGAVARNE